MLQKTRTKVDATVSTDGPQTKDAATTADQTGVDACVSTDGPQTKDAATTADQTMVDACVSTDKQEPTTKEQTTNTSVTVMCDAEIQTTINGGGGVPYESKMQEKDQKIRELEVSNTYTQ